MKERMVKGTDYKSYKCVEFGSMDEFSRYLSETPFNEAFRWSRHSSVENGYEFTQTHSFEEANDLLKNGWDDMAQKLNKRLDTKDKQVEQYVKQITAFDVCGYQACVPRYLQGIPTSMVSKKNITVKQKVITINKCVNYRGKTKTHEIVEESVKAFQIIKKLEAQGLRVNLNVILGTEEDVGFIVKVRVKNANERLNIAKMAFVMCHPSMLRRMLFRFIEVFPETTRRFVGGYGFPIDDESMKEACKGEYYLPPFFSCDVQNLDSMHRFYAG